MSSTTKHLHVSADIAEFMLDLPEGTTIVGASFDDGRVVLEVETDFSFADTALLVYSNDEYGNSALVGSTPM